MNVHFKAEEMERRKRKKRWRIRRLEGKERILANFHIQWTKKRKSNGYVTIILSDTRKKKYKYFKKRD